MGKLRQKAACIISVTSPHKTLAYEVYIPPPSLSFSFLLGPWPSSAPNFLHFAIYTLPAAYLDHLDQTSNEHFV